MSDYKLELLHRSTTWSMVATVIGGGMIVAFMFMATALGHVKKYLQGTPEQKQEEQQNIVKNISIIGAIVYIVSRALANP